MKLQLPILFFFLLPFSAVLGQKEPSRDLLSILSTDQKFVRLAVDSSICLIRQEYTLIDAKGNEYGRKSDRYFGRKYLLGVIADSGIWVSSEIRLPWVDDKNFDKFKHSDSLRPHLTKTLFKRPGQQVFTEFRDTLPGGPAMTPLLTLARPDSLPAIGSAVDTKDAEGWLVLINDREDPGTSDTMNLVYNTYKPKLSFGDSSGRAYIRNLPEGRFLIGGIYYTCMISLGRISFAAAGILKKDEKGWYIYPLPGKETRHSKKTDELRRVQINHPINKTQCLQNS